MTRVPSELNAAKMLPGMTDSDVCKRLWNFLHGPILISIYLGSSNLTVYPSFQTFRQLGKDDSQSMRPGVRIAKAALPYRTGASHPGNDFLCLFSSVHRSIRPLPESSLHVFTCCGTLLPAVCTWSEGIDQCLIANFRTAAEGTFPDILNCRDDTLQRISECWYRKLVFPFCRFTRSSERSAPNRT